MKKIKSILITLLVLVIALVIWQTVTGKMIDDSIQKERGKIAEISNDTIPKERGKLVSQEFITTISSNQIEKLFPEANELEGDVSKVVKFDIDIYKVTYTSTFQHKIVELSGLLVVPKTDKPLWHLQYHHGTLLPYPSTNGEGSLDAPSLFDGEGVITNKSQYETRLFGLHLGSYGYLVSLPDYIGYGKSDNYEHTYSVNDRLAEQSVDMILATKEFCSKNKIELNSKTFLAGWSEGGAASVATQKLIEKSYSDRIQIAANAPLAGFYNPTYYAQKMISYSFLLWSDLGEDLDVLIWTLYSINLYADDNPLPNNKLFKFDVHNQTDVLKNRPTSRLSRAIKYLSTENKIELLKKFDKSNLTYGWKPIAPIYFHHGTDDDIVYYDNNVEIAVNNLSDNGANTHLVKYEKHNHYTLAHLYLLNMLTDFEKHK